MYIVTAKVPIAYPIKTQLEENPLIFCFGPLIYLKKKKQPTCCLPADPACGLCRLIFSVLAVSIAVRPEIVHMTGDRLNPSWVVWAGDFVVSH